jgi:hypothetical protein
MTSKFKALRKVAASETVRRRQGEFSVRRPAPGKYHLFAWEEVNDDLWQDPDFRKKYENLSTELSVGPSETEDAQLRLIPAER